MKVEKQEQVTYLVTLTAEEASYIKATMQNCYMYKSNTEEPQREHNLRATIYEGLNNKGVK